MSPAEAARTLDAAKALHSGRAHLRLVGSVDNPDADAVRKFVEHTTKVKAQMMAMERLLSNIVHKGAK